MILLRYGLAVAGASALVQASPAMAAFACDQVQDLTAAPYSEAKFQAALDHAKLQLPTSSTCLTNTKITSYYYDPDNWYLDNTNMQFEIDDGAGSQRNELRGDSFAGTRTDMTFRSRMKVRYGSTYSDRFTVAQIYGETGGQPILRVEFLASRSGLSNRFWGIYRTNAGPLPSYEYQDLGPAPTAFTELKLVYNDNGTVTAQLGTNPKRTWSTNFAYYAQSWKTTYFKTGCYLQDPGDCYVRLSTLVFDT
jgi:hypothetical protein